MGERVVIGVDLARADDLTAIAVVQNGAVVETHSVDPTALAEALLLQATRTAARSRQFAKRARQFLSECQSVSCGGASPKIPQ
jgi:phage terminase large subunit-like protein